MLSFKSKRSVNLHYLVKPFCYVKFFLGPKRMLQISYSALKLESAPCLLVSRKKEKVCTVVFIFLVTLLLMAAVLPPVIRNKCPET